MRSIQRITGYLDDRHRGIILLLITLSALIYLPFLNSPFFFDDWLFLSSQFMESAYFDSVHLDTRWFSLITLSWTWRLFLDSPLPFRLGNLLLHASNAIMLFYLVKQLLLRSSPELTRHQALMSASVAAMIFCAHPVASYAVGYVVQRSILLATFFVLAMHLSYVKGLLSGKTRWFTLTVLLYFLAIFSKEHAIMAILSLGALTILYRKKMSCDLKLVFLTGVACLTIASFLLSRTQGIIGVSYETDASTLMSMQEVDIEHVDAHLLSVLTQMGLYFKYLWLWIVPNPAWMSIDMRETIVVNLDSWRAWAGPIGFLAYGLIATRLLFATGRVAMLGWAMLFPWLFYWVEFSTFRIQEPFVLYRSYLWFAGFSGVFCYLVTLIPPKRMVVVSLMIMMALVPISWNRLWVCADQYRLWNDAAKLIDGEDTPGAARIYYNRGNAELARSQWQEAMQDFHRVIRHNPEMEAPYNNLGIIHFNLGHYSAAIDYFEQAIARNPNFAQAYFGKSVTLKRLNQDDASRRAMQKSCELGHYVACAVIEAQGE